MMVSAAAAVVGCWGGATRCSTALPAPRLPPFSAPPGDHSNPLPNPSPRCAPSPPLHPGPLCRRPLPRHLYSSLSRHALSISFSHSNLFAWMLVCFHLAAGPKEWLKEQKRKAAKFVLAPIEASRQSIRNAYDMLGLDLGTAMDYQGEVRRLLNSASRDCVPQDRSSIVAFQASTGVEVCTFRLILKNASSLLDDEDPVKLEAETKLGDLIRSFSSIGSVIDKSDFQLIDDRQKVKDGLMDTIYSLDKFEQGIKDCLGA